jgi:hypothetical protein
MGTFFIICLCDLNVLVTGEEMQYVYLSAGTSNSYPEEKMIRPLSQNLRRFSLPNVLYFGMEVVMWNKPETLSVQIL